MDDLNELIALLAGKAVDKLPTKYRVKTDAKPVNPTKQDVTRIAKSMKSFQANLRSESETDPRKARKFGKDEVQTIPSEFLDKRAKERQEELTSIGEMRVVKGGTPDPKTGERKEVATTQKTPFLGGKKAKTLAGGEVAETLRKQLEHTELVDPSKPKSFKNPVKKYSHEKNFPQRQKEVEQLAKKADPFMRQIEQTGRLSATHDYVDPARSDAWNRVGDYDIGPGQKVQRDGEDVYGVGANRYGNKEEIVPEPVKKGFYNERDRGLTSRKNVWSEADLDPLTMNNRKAGRLLHTSPDTEVDSQLSGESKSKKIDQRFYISDDHYKSSAVPVSPVSEKRYTETQAYKNNANNRGKFTDPEKDLKKRAKNSLEYQDRLEKERKEKENKALDEDALKNPTRDVATYDRAVKASNPPKPPSGQK